MPVGTTVLSIHKDVRTAISEFPVADGGFSDVDAEGHACGEDAYQSCSDPSLTGLENGAKGTTYATFAMYRSGPIGVFDLCMLAFVILWAVVCGLLGHGASQWLYSHCMEDALL